MFPFLKWKVKKCINAHKKISVWLVLVVHFDQFPVKMQNLSQPNLTF